MIEALEAIAHQRRACIAADYLFHWAAHIDIDDRCATLSPSLAASAIPFGCSPHRYWSGRVHGLLATGGSQDHGKLAIIADRQPAPSA
jgi:hypothetical protein